jgi:hypothetical protein
MEGWMKAMWKSALLGAGAVFALAIASPANAQDLDALKEELKAMKERLATLEADKASARRAAPAAAVEAGDKPRSWKIPGTNTSMNISGWARLSVLWDVSGGGVGTDLVNPSSAVAKGNNAANNRGNGGNWRLHAKESRFRIQTWTPTDWGELRTYIETDFFTAANQLRLRHAYGTLGPVVAGQTDSTWRASFSEGSTLDFGGIVGTPGFRRGIVQYNHNLGNGWVLQAALEDPTAPAIISGTSASRRFPDAVVAINWYMPTARIWVSGIVRDINHDTGTGASAASALAYGVAAAFEWNVTPQFYLSGSGSVGWGVGSYLNDTGFADAVVTGTTTVRTIFTLAGQINAGYKVTPTITINGGFGYAWADVRAEVAKAAIPAGTSNSVWYAHGNIVWSPVPNVNFGVEYVFAWNNRYNGPNADVNRLILRAHYAF